MVVGAWYDSSARGGEMVQVRVRRLTDAVHHEPTLPQRIVLAVDFGDVAGGCRLVAQSRDVLTRDHLTGTEPGRVLCRGGAVARVGSLVCLDGLVQTTEFADHATCAF